MQANECCDYIEVMKQAREALESLWVDKEILSMEDHDKAIASLTAAIEQMEKAEPVVVTDEMAYAFHHALTDGSIGEDEVEEIKTGLRAALANVGNPAQQSTELRTIHEILMSPGDCPPVAEGDTLTVRMLKDYVRARKAYAIPEGWQPMPKEPTNKMYDAWNNSNLSGFNERYKALLAAAPKPEDVK